jgi:coenzyme PQQ precursor peptide PqqA
MNGKKKKAWMKPFFIDLRLGFEISMYVWTK